jgi:hypothetical protein
MFRSSNTQRVILSTLWLLVSLFLDAKPTDYMPPMEGLINGSWSCTLNHTVDGAWLVYVKASYPDKEWKVYYSTHVGKHADRAAMDSCVAWMNRVNIEWCSIKEHQCSKGNKHGH